MLLNIFTVFPLARPRAPWSRRSSSRRQRRCPSTPSVSLPLAPRWPRSTPTPMVRRSTITTATISTTMSRTINTITTTTTTTTNGPEDHRWLGRMAEPRRWTTAASRWPRSEWTILLCFRLTNLTMRSNQMHKMWFLAKIFFQMHLAPKTTMIRRRDVLWVVSCRDFHL